MRLGPIIKYVIATVLVCFFLWFVGTLVGISTVSVDTAIVLRTLFSCLALVFVTISVVRRSDVFPISAFVVAASLAYAAFPPTWGARALFSQLFLDPGILTIICDYVVWMGLALLVYSRTYQAPSAVERSPYQPTQS